MGREGYPSVVKASEVDDKCENGPPHFWVYQCGPTNLSKHPLSLSGSERNTQTGEIAHQLAACC